MCRFLKFIPSEEALWLLKNKGHAFRLLTIIAESARRTDGNPDGLKIGECFIGGFENYDMTERNYRTAKDILIKRRHIEIVETCRTRKKSTTGTTTVGTKVRLLSSTVWDINSNSTDDRSDDCPTTDRRPTDDKQESKEDISNDISKEEDAIRHESAQPASPPRARNKSDSMTFDFEKWEFQGISEKDWADWKLMYPHIDLQIEMLKAINWLKNNPSRNNKKNWRKYLTGWYGRSNDSIENKKAYRSAASGTSQDKRTKNMDGTPIKSRAEDLF